MSANRPYSATIDRVAGTNGETLVCRSCGHGLGPADAVWKEAARLEEGPLRETGGAVFEATDPKLLLRRFYCPGCGVALDTETALEGEPFLVDRVRG
ncbi:acetone carboxylase subunit gamma [Microbaculum marinum]|uniref:Acetone carboxylase subunit gamma n=1 Tax=Microbaculum marinum TaxID=1764581 RepID=A0AAW9RZD3_9HYPH